MARRVNTKFLVILTVFVLGLAGAFFVTMAVVKDDKPDPYVEAGQKAMQEQNYEAALKNFQQAVSIDQRSAEIWYLYADAFSKLSHVDVENIYRAQLAWNKALEIDPYHSPSLTRLLELYEAQIELGAQQNLAVLIEQSRSVASRLAQAQPDNFGAATSAARLTLDGWRMGVETPVEKVEDAIAKLTELATKDPTNAENPFHVAAAKIYHAFQYRQQNQPADAERLLKEAEQVMMDAVKANPDSGQMQFRGGQILMMLGMMESNPEKSAQFRPRIKQHLQKAFQLIKPDEKNYVEAAVLNAQQPQQRDQQNKLFKDLLAARPDDQFVRLQVADQLKIDTETRDEAIAILEQPVKMEKMTGAKAYVAMALELQTLISLTNIRLDLLSVSKDQTEKKDLQTKVEEGYNKIVTKIGDDRPVVLKLKGKLERIQNKKIDSIQTLQKALTALDQQQSTKDLNYYEIVDLLSRSYIDTNQTGEAKKLLGRLLEWRDNYLPARVLLAQLLVRERKFDEAREHIEWLELNAANRPETTRLKLAMLDTTKDQSDIQQVLAKMPEGTRAEKLDKAGVAVVTGNLDIAQALIEPLIQADPKDAEATVLLARIHIAGNDRDKALQTLTAGLKANPKHQGLLSLVTMLQPPDGAQGGQLKRELIAQVSDPLLRELQYADLARLENKIPESLTHLKNAEQINATDQRVREALFTHYMMSREFDNAQPYLDALVKSNGDQANGLLYRTRFAMAKGDAATALNFARELTQKMPEFSQSWLVLGQSLQMSGQPQDAVQHYRTSLEKQPDNLDALRGLIDCYFLLNRPNDAQRYIQDGLNRYPDNPFFKDLQVTYEINFGDPENAVEPRKQSKERNPSDPQTWRALGQTYIAVGRARLAKKDEAGAAEAFGNAMVTYRQAMGQFPDERRFYGAFAEAAIAAKKPDEGEAALKQLATRPDWQDKPEPAMMMADFYSRVNRREDAENAARTLVAKFPTNIDVQLGFSDMLLQSNKPQEALAALQTNLNDPRVSRRRVEIHILMNQLDEADKALKEALAQDQGSVEMLSLAGFVNMRLGRWDDAANRLKQALNLDPGHENATFYLAQVRLGQPVPEVDEAIKLLTQLRNQNPQFVDARFALAHAYQRKNQHDFAIRELEAALQLDPLNKRIRLALVDLYTTAVPPRWMDTERALRQGREMPEFKNDVDFLLAESRMWSDRKNTARALELIRVAQQVEPKNGAIFRQYVKVLIEAKDWPAVTRETSKVLEVEKSLWWAHEARGIARRYADDKDGALQDFEAALTIANDQNNHAAASQIMSTLAREIGLKEALDRVAPRAETQPRWRLIQAHLYQSNNETQLAAETIEKSLAEYDRLNQSEREAALRFAGALYMVMLPANTQKAYEAYLKLLDMAPNDLPALNNMAVLLGESINPPRPGEALKYSQRAFEIMNRSGHRDPLLMDTHGWMLALNGQTDEAIEVLRQAVSIKSFVDVHYHLAEAYLKKSAPQEAQIQLEMAADRLRKQEEETNKVDETFRGKIANASARAREMLRSKSGQATAVTP